ncbi:endolytic transglycosylase MltG [Pedobacter frigiditerrae]|uniref:endolytic transglycosylase MltG n=1 Tax=Pedobacter frigiditerrae TaxID=2530452 RepID=UPI00292CF7EB|nr:endolytic transglycosylase MltG [Pedobacter frigiditerrae]
MILEHDKKAKKSTKIILAIILVALAVGGYFGLNIYKTYLAGNITGNQKYIYVKTGMDYDGFLHNLLEKGILKNPDAFKEAAEKMNLPKSLKPGRYAVKEGMNNRTLINKLKAGNQDAVKLKFQNIRKKENFAAYLAKNMEADSLSFIKVLDSAALVEKYGFTTENVYTLFIPNTYELYWNVSPTEFFEKMVKQYNKFWTEERKNKAKALNLTPIQVSILASIVDSEALYDKEMPTIAGLYLNRLNKGILLQADPTVIFANDDFTIKRVLNSHLALDSRYNTYKYAGLPPGPIMMPSINAIDAVLNRENNNYIYMCAKEDFSGYHAFAETREQHEINANKYRAAMNKRNIYK